MKKYLLFFSTAFISTLVLGQTKINSINGFHFSAGLNLAAAPDPFDNLFGVGVELQPEYRLSKRFAIYGSAGYTNFFDHYYDNDENENSKRKTRGIGFVPILAGGKFHFGPVFFAGAKAGVALINSNDDYSNGFHSEFCFQPQIGFSKNRFQANIGFNAIQHNGVALSLGFLYNIK